MTGFNKTEKTIFQIFVAVLALVCLIPGAAGAFGGINASSSLAGGALIFDSENMLRGFIDNQYRFGFGVFFTQGLALLFFLKNINQYSLLFRFSALSLFIGGIGRASNILEFGVVDSLVVAPTIVELVIVPLLVIWHLRVAKYSYA